MKIKKSKRLLSLFLAVLMLLTAFPIMGLTASADMPSTTLFQYTQFRNNATNTNVGDRTDTQIPLVADSSTGAFSYAIAGFNIGNVSTTAALAAATLSGTLDRYSSSTALDMKIEFHLIPNANLWQSFAGINADGWKVTTQGSRGTLQSGQDNYSYICGQLGLSADTLIGSVAHGETSYSFKMGEKLLAAREAGATQIKVIAIYSTVNSGSASSACWMNHPSLKVNTASSVFSPTHKYALSNQNYDSSSNNRYSSTEVNVTSEGKNNSSSYSYGLWEFDLSSIDTDAVKIDSSELRITNLLGDHSKLADLHIDFYLVPADKMTNQYASPSSTADGQYKVTLNGASASYNPTDTIKSALGLNENNLIGTADHPGNEGGTNNWSAPFAGKLAAALAAGQTTVKVIGLHRTVNTDTSENGRVWSDVHIKHPTIFVNVSPKASQIETVSETLQVSDWGVVNAEANYNRYNESKEAVNIVSEKKSNPTSNVFSMGWWTLDIPESLKNASIDSAPLKVSVLNETNFGYATPSIADMAVDFYILNYKQYGNDAWFTQPNRQVTDVALQNGAEAALAHVKSKFNLGNSVATLVHGNMGNTYRLHNAVRDAVRRGDSKLLIIAVQRTPNILAGTNNWSDTWLKFPSLTVYSAQRAYSTTIDRSNDEDAVTGRITMNNAIYTHDSADVYKYGKQIATTDKTDYETTFTVTEGTLKSVKCVEDGSNSNLSATEKSTDVYVLSGSFNDAKFSCDPNHVDDHSNVTATLMFTFDDGAVEYHRVAVKSVPVPAHQVIRAWKGGGQSQGWVTVARGSVGSGGHGTWSYLDKWLPGTTNHGTPEKNWKFANEGYPSAGNYGGQDGHGEGDTSSAKVAATYYFDKSNHNLGSGKYFINDTQYKIPFVLHTAHLDGSQTYPHDNKDLQCKTRPSSTTVNIEGLHSKSNNGEIDGTVYLTGNQSISTTDPMTADGSNDKTQNVYLAARALSDGGWPSYTTHWTQIRFDVTVHYFDKSPVRSKYIEYINHNYKENDYTATSYAAYMNALLEVEAWLTNYEITDSTNAYLVSKLEMAAAGLKQRADLTALDNAYRQADLAIRTISNRAPAYAQSAVNQIITDASNTSTRDYINSTYDQRRDYDAAAHQTNINNKATALTNDVNALTALDTSTFEAALPDSHEVDKDIYSVEHYQAAIDLYEQGIGTATYTDRNGNEYTVPYLVDSTQEELDNRVAQMTENINTALNHYKVEIPAGVTADYDNLASVPYGTKVTLTADNPDTAWFMEYKSNDTGRGKQYQAKGDTYSFVVYGNMTITTGQREENTVKVTIERKYDSSNTNLPIEDIKYLAEGTVIDLNQYAKSIPFYSFVNFTDAQGKVITDGQYTVGKKDVTLYVNYRYDSSLGGSYQITATALAGGKDVNISGAAYNSRVKLEGGADAYAWVEQIKNQTDVWRPFYIGANVTFFVQESVTLKAVTKAEYDAMFNGVTAATNLMQCATLPGGAPNEFGGKIIVNAQFVLPEGAKALEYGILLNRYPDEIANPDQDLVLEKIPEGSTNKDANDHDKIVRAKSTVSNDSHQYSIRLTKLKDSYQYRSYLIYQYNKNGNIITETIYSDVRSEAFPF